MERLQRLSCWNGEEVVLKTTGEVRESLCLGEGRTNQNFVAMLGEKRFFVRLGGELPYFGVNRPREQGASRAAAAIGVAPPVVYTEAPDVLVLDFVDGRALTEADLHRAAHAGPSDPLLANITKTIRTLHEAPIPEELKAFATEVGGSTGWGGPHFRKFLAYAKAEGFSRQPLLEGVDELVARLERAAGQLGEDRFCHFDLLADNLVLRKDGEVSIVDFEYTAPGQPLMDLAVLSMGCSLSPEEERNLLASYLETLKVPEEQVYAFSALKVLAALRETLWGTTAELSKTSSLSLEEAAAYVDMNFAKLQTMRAEFEKLPVPEGRA